MRNVCGTRTKQDNPKSLYNGVEGHETNVTVIAGQIFIEAL